MKASIIELLALRLVGQKIFVYEYDAYHLNTKRRITHYHTNDKEHARYYQADQWEDMKESKVEVEITKVGGGFIPYEGNYVDIEFEGGHINLEVDSDLEFPE